MFRTPDHTPSALFRYLAAHLPTGWAADSAGPEEVRLWNTTGNSRVLYVRLRVVTRPTGTVGELDMIEVYAVRRDGVALVADTLQTRRDHATWWRYAQTPAVRAHELDFPLDVYQRANKSRDRAAYLARARARRFRTACVGTTSYVSRLLAAWA